MADAAQGLGKLRDVWPDVWPHLRPERGGVALLILASVPLGFLQAGLVTLVAETAVAIAAGEATVTVRVSGLGADLSIQRAIVVGFVVAILLTLLNVVTSYYPAKIVANAQSRMRDHLFERFVHTAWAVQSREANGHLQEVMTTQVNRTAMLLLGLAKAVPEALVLLGLVVSALLIAPAAAAAMTVVGALLFVAFRPLAGRTRRHARTHAIASEHFAAAVNEAVHLGEEYHVFGVEDAQAAVVAREVEAVRGPFLSTKYMVDLVGGLYGSMVLVLLVVGLAGLQLVPNAEVGAIGAVVLVLLRALTAGRGLQSTYTQLYNNLPYLERALEAQHLYEGSTVTHGDRPLGAIESFRFDRVSYGYDADEPALTDVSFDVPAGATIGIVGPSGAGKSTAIQILLRLRTPDEGRYLVSGIDAREFSNDDWTRAVAYVPQTPKLLLGTVADNIRFHRPEVSDADVERAARLAHVHDEIVAWPGGYDRRIGQGAAAVSGGQRQRISLARALATGPEVLILDEPTSALDPNSERLVQRSLEDLRAQGVTLFIIAHRAATLSFVDHLLVFDEGRLVASGPPETVVSDDAYVRSALAELRPPVPETSDSTD